MKKIFNTISLQDLILYGGAISIATLVFVFLISVTMIGYGVKDTCQMAKNVYGLDCVGSLIAYMDDASHDMRNRNSAVWALGQLGDTRAMPTLQKYYSGYSGERCDLNTELCQLQIQRAIGYMQGSPNITTFFWRFGTSIE